MTEQKQTSGETSVLERTIPERAVHDQVLNRVHNGVHGPSVLRVPEPSSQATQQGNHMKLFNAILICLTKQKGRRGLDLNYGMLLNFIHILDQQNIFHGA